jgi:hypothetical protein
VHVIDFANGTFVKLSPVDPAEAGEGVAALLIPGERVLQAYKAMRDYVVFTDKRLIAVNVQGMTGKKKDFTSLPYSKIQAFRSRQQEHSIWTQNSIFGSAALARSVWNSKVAPIFVSSVN